MATAFSQNLYVPPPPTTDWVRLRAGLVPPHWNPGGTRWDAGYHVTAYFLEWLTDRYGEGTIPELNELMKDAPYDELVFKTVTGRKVDKLWRLYKEHLDGGSDGYEVSQDQDS